MKKNIIILTALILSLNLNGVFAADIVNNVEDLENLHEIFYEEPTGPIPNVKVIEGSTQGDVRGMPWFKKTRIKVTNYLRERDYQKTLELIEKEKKLQEEFEAREYEEIKKEVNVNYIDTTEESVSSEEKTETVELSGQVKEKIAPNDMMLDADNIDYNEETMEIVATGSPVLKFPPQGVELKAGKITYNNGSNTFKAYGEVKITRNGKSTYGDYMEINLNEESALLDNLHTKESFMTIKARKSEIQGDTLILHNGKMVSEDSYILNLQTKMIGGNQFFTMMVDDEDKSSITDEIGETAIKVKAKEIHVDAKKDHNIITLKQARIDYGDFNLLNLRKLRIHTNKQNQYFEANYPEFGSRGRLGMFAGPGFTFDTPMQNGSTMKFIPIVNSKSGDTGIGAMLKYRSATNFTYGGYGSGADAFIMKGKQYLDDKLYMQYGVNSYMNEWFMGPRMAKYNAELIYHDMGVIPSTIGQGLDLRFRHRAGFGYMHDGDFNRKNESIQTSDLGTTRTRYMAEIAQSLFKYKDAENLKAFNLDLVMQGSAALYGTGDTQFVGRMGPRVRTQYKNWWQDVAFYTAAYHDKTPLPVYDTYRYGHASVYIREALRVHKYLTLAWSSVMNLTGDSPNGKTIQENAFIFALGPDDFKVNFGYDWIRQRTYFSLVIAMDTKGSAIEYDKMVIKNPDRLAKHDEEKVELKVFDSQAEGQTKKMKYAEVIDIEDPDKEQI